MSNTLEETKLNIINPSKVDERERMSLVEEMGEFFRTQVTELTERFPSFNNEDILGYINDHVGTTIMLNIGKDDKLFRIIKNRDGCIVGYFEASIIKSEIGDFVIAQWLLIKKELRNGAVSGILWTEFLNWIDVYMDIHHLSSMEIFSDCNRENTPAINFHQRHGFTQCGWNKGKGYLIWRLTRRREK